MITIIATRCLSRSQQVLTPGLSRLTRLKGFSSGMFDLLIVDARCAGGRANTLLAL